jgi:hypothetical protein
MNAGTVELKIDERRRRTGEWSLVHCHRNFCWLDPVAIDKEQKLGRPVKVASSGADMPVCVRRTLLN